MWIVIFSYVGNYFWTHYFFTVLGASYTFPSWRMNNVSHNNSNNLCCGCKLFCLVILFIYGNAISIYIYFYFVQVPHTTFLLTHVCFLFYHMSSNITLRRLRHSTADLPEKIQWFTEAAWILALAYFIAYLETIAISNVSIFMISVLSIIIVFIVIIIFIRTFLKPPLT